MKLIPPAQNLTVNLLPQLALASVHLNTDFDLVLRFLRPIDSLELGRDDGIEFGGIWFLIHGAADRRITKPGHHLLIT